MADEKRRLTSLKKEILIWFYEIEKNILTKMSAWQIAYKLRKENKYLAETEEDLKKMVDSSEKYKLRTIKRVFNSRPEKLYYPKQIITKQNFYRCVKILNQEGYLINNSLSEKGKALAMELLNLWENRITKS